MRCSLKARQRNVFVLNPNDCVLVTPNIIHKALVPDGCEKSALAAFVFEIKDTNSLIEKYGYIFEREEEETSVPTGKGKRKRTK